MKLTWCRECDAPVSEQDVFCPRCGKGKTNELSATAVCCGIDYEIIGRKSAYCIRCGTALRLNDNVHLPG
jgi:ribosomal protein S27AE